MDKHDLSMIANPDSQAWAKYFIEKTKNMDREAFRDEGYMIAWFANAMMAMHDHLTGHKISVLDDGSAFFVGEVK